MWHVDHWFQSSLHCLPSVSVGSSSVSQGNYKEFEHLWISVFMREACLVIYIKSLLSFLYPATVKSALLFIIGSNFRNTGKIHITELTTLTIFKGWSLADVSGAQLVSKLQTGTKPASQISHLQGKPVLMQKAEDQETSPTMQAHSQ